MSPGDFLSLLAVVVGSVSIVGILTGAYKSKMRVRERELELQILRAGQAPATPTVDDRTEQRLRVLERIATDKGPNLAAEIEQLRDERLKEVI
ncbi:hypothetical protein ACFFF7_02800 [Novosphingobium aquiterrae]|uniref:Uncharacterized protein n=1 Tax=Novosphingobium aquiterrae TaxID=624388 RepID=A0ABV6PES9_9SPHN